jgi:hypothetical protein
MSITDIVVMALILGGASYLFYRSVVKKKGHCQGCDSEVCTGKRKLEINSPRSLSDFADRIKL